MIQGVFLFGELFFEKGEGRHDLIEMCVEEGFIKTFLSGFFRETHDDEFFSERNGVHVGQDQVVASEGGHAVTKGVSV